MTPAQRVWASSMSQSAWRKRSSCRDDCELEVPLSSTARATADYRLVEEWQEHRHVALGVALRMLGNINDAEDVVQEAYVRLARRGLDDIDDVRGWLIVVVSRLCLDQLRSARSRRERPAADAAEVRTADAARDPDDPIDRISLDDSVRQALLVILERLSPAERVAFVLHDVFQLPFDEIAAIVGRSAQACRQLASRARRRIESESGAPRFAVDAPQHQLVAERFVSACAGGDLDALTAILDPAVVGIAWRGGIIGRRAITGRERVARRLVKILGDARVTLVALSIEGTPSVLAFRDRRLVAALTLESSGGLIDHIDAVLDRRRLTALARIVSASA